jgi:hypothetical protein
MAQIGTVKIKTSGGTKSVPIYDVNDSGAEVYECWRVHTSSGTGFIPLTSVSKAAFPEVKVKTGSGILAVHDVETQNTSTTKTFEDFEGTPSSRWDIWQLSTSSKSYEGSQSAYFGGYGDGTSLAERTLESGGAQISWISFWYYEPGNTTGHGIRLVNSNGDYEVGAMTDNPQFSFDDASGPHRLNEGDPNYSNWTKCTVYFDWAKGEATVEFTDNTTGSETGNLKQGVDIERIELWTYSSGTWGRGNYDQHNYWDLIKYKT